MRCGGHRVFAIRPCAPEHLEVLGGGGQAHLERLGQRGDRDLARYEADRIAREIDEATHNLSHRFRRLGCR